MTPYNKPSILLRIRRNFLLILAIIGIIFACIFSFSTGTEKKVSSNITITPSPPPFENNIAGIGFIESSSRNINIGSFTPGIISEVKVTEGDRVSRGDVLFIIDQRAALAEVENKKNAVAVAMSEISLAEVKLNEAKDNLRRAKGLTSGHSISQEDFQKRHFALERAKSDLDIKKAQMAQAKSALELANVALEKTEIRSPIDGSVLKIRIAAGEFISGNEQDANAPMLLGTTNPLHVRVQIDENDIYRFDEKMNAYAFLRSDDSIKLPLSFIRIEPYAIAKGNITGTGTELVDTRIIEIIYRIDTDVKDIKNLYIGQHLDIFIESAEGK